MNVSWEMNWIDSSRKQVLMSSSKKETIERDTWVLECKFRMHKSNKAWFAGVTRWVIVHPSMQCLQIQTSDNWIRMDWNILNWQYGVSGPLFSLVKIILLQTACFSTSLRISRQFVTFTDKNIVRIFALLISPVRWVGKRLHFVFVWHPWPCHRQQKLSVTKIYSKNAWDCQMIQYLRSFRLSVCQFD